MTHYDEIKNYWDKRAEGYSQKSNADLGTEQAKLWTERLCEVLPKGENLKCLDIGCGPGFMGLLLGKLGHTVFLCDNSEAMLEKAAENAADVGIEVTTRLCNAQQPDFEDDLFDVIVSRNLVWNLEQPEIAYKQWLRILKPGGKIIVFDGNHYLHLFDSVYQGRQKHPDYIDVHTKEFMKGVDPNIMRTIAHELPLSRCERPAWDIEFFLSNKVSEVYVRPTYLEYTDINGGRHTIIEEFVISVHK